MIGMKKENRWIRIALLLGMVFGGGLPLAVVNANTAPAAPYEDGAEQSKTVHVQVKGLVCDFCAQGIKKGFAAHKAVASVTVSLKKGEVDLFLRSGTSISDKEIKKIIEDNGIGVVSITRKSAK